MRLFVRLRLDKESAIPINHQHALAGCVYKLLAISSEEYSAFLHDEGYRTSQESAKTAKLFCFSGLRADRSRRRISGDRIIFAPGEIDWQISSPRKEFLLHSATGLLSAGNSIEICETRLEIESVTALPTPSFSENERFTCLSPIIAPIARPDRTTEYVRPRDAAFSEVVRKNLLWKYQTLNGANPQDDRLRMVFDPRYLAEPKNHEGTKLVTFKRISMVGALAPFNFTGSPELMQIAWDCGVGSRNGIGMGMVEARG